MKPTITYEEVLAATTKKKIGFVDVRTPQEYELSTIPGAINIPILNNDARVEIGILYANKQISEAKYHGIQWVSKQLPDMYLQYQELCQEYDELALFCSKGGMRSSSIFSLLKSLGLPVSRIKGGYKAYRHYVNEHLDEQLMKANFVTLYGLSGTGKTEILKELALQGENILDIEGCANHRGSVLGGIGLSEPHSQKKFESLLFDISRGWKEGETVYTEGESKRIGKVVMPPSLYEAIQKGRKIYIEAPIEKRVEQIHHDYVDGSNLEELASSLEPLRKSINEEKVATFQEQIRQDNADLVIEKLLLSYYDPRYNHNKTQREKNFINLDVRSTAEEIRAWLKAN